GEMQHRARDAVQHGRTLFAARARPAMPFAPRSLEPVPSIRHTRHRFGSRRATRPRAIGATPPYPPAGTANLVPGPTGPPWRPRWRVGCLKLGMLTLLDISRAIDRLGEAAFVPRTLRARFTYLTPAVARVTFERATLPVRRRLP